MKQSKDNKSLLNELRGLLDNNANILADSYIRRLGGKLTILYLRLSRDDDLEGESSSISNQRVYLTNYAKKNKFKNVMVFYDDGISGVTFDRDDFVKVLKLIELDMVENLIVKDLSRIGREHIKTDTLLEITLPKHNVRFISVNDGIDTGLREDDTIAFRNLTNEWYARDISRKVRSAHRAKSSQGYAIGHPPFGYMYDEKDKKKWVVDPDASETVKYIYSLRKQGYGLPEIAKILTRKKILIPSMYALKKGFRKPAKIPICEYMWRKENVRTILTNRSYVGDVVNFKTYSRSFKLRERLENPEEKREIHENIHEAIIERSVWQDIQNTFGNVRYKKPKHTEKHIFAGLLKCSDCGANLNYKYTHTNPDNHYFSCKNNRSGEGLCKKTHHIRVDKLTELLTKNLSSIVNFANCFEDEFVKIVMDENYKMVVATQNRNQKELQRLLARDKEIDNLVEKLFEEKVLGNLSAERLAKLSAKYDEEQIELKAKIQNLEAVVCQEKSHELNVEAFLERVHKYSDIKELTPEILHEFIDKVVVHHREQIDGQTVQKVEIYYKMVGKVEIPNMGKAEKEKYLKIFGSNRKERIA